jgi:DNA-binding NtrC family response regulator
MASTAPRPPVTGATPPALFVHALSESLESLWPTLATQLGLQYIPVSTLGAVPAAAQGLVIVAAAGDEARLPEALRGAAGGNLPVVAVGVDEGRRTAIDALRAGAAEYFCLPQEVDALRAWIRTVVEAIQQRSGADQYADTQRQRHTFEGVYGDSPAILEAITRAERVLPHDRLTLLLTGETGTGKEVFARAIHYNGPRRAMPFVAVNCAAIPLHLLESELFGHERGAFTGASAPKPGLFEVANGGTLLLDEIGHMDLTLQGKLLRALEERTIRRVGGSKDSAIDVRVLAATHVDLGRAVARGEFRADLYYRLNVVAITLPPLRERGHDVLILARRFVTKVAADYRIAEPTLSDGAKALISRYTWPGNVRELRNAMERATLLASNGVILDSDLEIDEQQGGAPSSGRLPFPAPLQTIVQTAIREMVALHGGNRSEAARRLGISRSRLHRLLGNGGDDAVEDE